MRKQNPPGRNKEGNHGAVPPELTSSGQGGGRLNRGWYAEIVNASSKATV